MKTFAVLALSVLVSPSAWARPTNEAEMCLIETGPSQSRWVTEAKKMEMIKENINFMDITDLPASLRSQPVEQMTVQFPTQLMFTSEGMPLANKISQAVMRKDLEKLTSFHNRYYRSQTGLQSANWVFDHVHGIIKSAGASKVRVEKFRHPKWLQPSVIITVPGKSNSTIILGAHMDSISGTSVEDAMTSRAPGADDNGTGTVIVMDVLRAMLSSQKVLRGEAENTIELHLYAAEEAGNLGSLEIFKKYKAEGRDVKAMMNKDMAGFTNGWKKAGKPVAFGVITDFTNDALNDFVRLVIKGYTRVPYVDGKCGYGCSDHAAAHRFGYPSAHIHESTSQYNNKDLHTINDVIELVDFGHCANHAKLAIGFLYELAMNKF
ncbi:Leucine aminopeptidase 1 [Ophidiomyces ophidiicola]|uniref:Leucine aminopeptidase 1 n=1 Tax=Ophidiomyces ophidiicola TaxID=1387563 RepID=UPI0020C47562|nr:Leucine aminopeptidase 1 [Ophidiomyces ophidiicola]KAI1911350.1 Leucine aminopeptidase 1 [Ophidiomyces ophidiicola]KAI1951852.1 Leucine aminopeptidase 1 [Ophidiomyces ophidiicola]KAI2009059.1 Leucine aminopeptidase 1 [Ophidiomyces ophidiicola]KAI2014247.1 Leucine aminopeptidase 1 [Ophidiomyces ophidiicola]KAI2021163.1 Leucine aminopeptidase 1 [Ophidiomyces ophidiicola]